MANNATLNVKLAMTETTTANELAADKNIDHVFEALAKLGATTTPVVTKVYAQQLQLSGGALTLNLTALTDGVGAALDLDTLKVQIFAVKNAPSTGAANTDTLNIKTGAVDGFGILGDTLSEATLAIGGFLVIYNPEGTADVAAAVDQVDFSSTDVDASFQVLIAAG